MKTDNKKCMQYYMLEIIKQQIYMFCTHVILKDFEMHVYVHNDVACTCT